MELRLLELTADVRSATPYKTDSESISSHIMDTPKKISGCPTSVGDAERPAVR
jgi:hypothetical protein